jgi:hypothetical protein
MFKNEIEQKEDNGDAVYAYNTYFTSRASAIIPAARGAEAEVPVCLIVQVFLRSVVACEINKRIQMMDLEALGS